MSAKNNIWNASIPLRFLVVGGWNFCFGYFVFVGLYMALSGTFSDWLIATVSNILGITNSYVCHRFFTYKSEGLWWLEYLKFYVVYGVQAAVNIVLIWFFVTYLEKNAYVVQLVITVFLTLLSYWAHKNYSFKRC